MNLLWNWFSIYSFQEPVRIIFIANIKQMIQIGFVWFNHYDFLWLKSKVEKKDCIKSLQRNLYTDI